MCGLSPVVTLAGACLQTYRDIYFNSYSTRDDNNNNIERIGCQPEKLLFYTVAGQSRSWSAEQV